RRLIWAACESRHPDGSLHHLYFFFQAEDGIRDFHVTGVQTCALPISRRNDDPQAASRPFDAERDGFVLGEGAGALVIESLESALDRGAKILGEIIGVGQTADAYHLTAPAPEGAGAQLAMRAALEDAGCAP